MNIATITYHWMPNYGAVLQTYALQKYLIEIGNDTEVIDYFPIKIFLRSCAGYVLRREWEKLARISVTRKFVSKEIIVTNKRYYSHSQLEKNKEKFDAYITGSDQIWCEWFIRNAEGRKKTTFSYFLDFVKEGKKIAYATSFGRDSLSNEILDKIQNILRDFDKIGLRELEGIEIIQKCKCCAELVSDPVFLINRKIYESLIKKSNIKSQQIYKYILQTNGKLASKIEKYIDHNLINIKYKKTFSVYDWLKQIADCELLITDSFHGIAFAIIFHTDFVIIPTKGKQFDSRIETLLMKLKLENRKCADEESIHSVIANKIDWNDTEIQLKKYILTSERFLQTALER